jgi:hypothetical protein
MSNYNTYNNNKKANEPFDPITYSDYRVSNAESAIDATCITYSYWKNLLKIGIYPKKSTNGDVNTFDMDNGIAIYLNHSKATILANEIRKFLSDPVTFNGSGVNSGTGIITISNGSEFGVDAPCIVIRKIDETGNVVSSYAYEFKRDYYFSIRNYTGNKNFNRETEEYRYAEINDLITLLEEYAKAMTHAIAHSVITQNRYNQDRLQTRINSIAEKLGVETGRGYRSGNGGGATNNFFNRAPANNDNSGGYVSATLDDID